MSLNQQDWPKLRSPILALGIAMVLVGLLVNFAEQYRTKNETALQAQQNMLNEARQKLQSSGLEKDTITQHLPIYNNLLTNGFIGEERRIEWIESLRQIHTQNKLFSIDYKIGLQEDYKPNFIPNMGSFVLHRSVMTLDFGMLHEGDLLTILDGLQVQNTPFITRDCEVVRTGSGAINTKEVLPNLRASCEVDWLTLRDPQLAKGL